MTGNRSIRRRSAMKTLAAGLTLAAVPTGSALANGGNGNGRDDDSTTKSAYADEDENGHPDEGEVVTGSYKALYAYDDSGDYYYDLGDGRVQGTVDSVSDLDQSTRTECF